MLRYGFIGLGNLGKHLAANLARGGFELAVFDLHRASADAVIAAGGRWGGWVSERARSCVALITCRPSPAASAAVMNEAMPFLHPGSTWIEMSTNDFVEVERIAARAAGVGVSTLVCPVTGGVHRAAAGDITVLVGGTQQEYSAHEPALKTMGGRGIYLGAIEH